MKNNVRVIFHIDLNAFFATCAMIKEPYLKNKVFAVGSPSQRGVLSTASYKARKYGIGAGMSVKEALKKYPKLLLVPLDFDFYKQKSKAFMSILEEYSDLILQASIDEAYVDMTHHMKTIHPIELAKHIQKRLLKDESLPCSIGIAPTLFLAKMASDLKKPLGITVLRKRDVKKVLYPMDVKDIHGIGKKTYPRLKQLGINTIEDFVNLSNLPMIKKVMSERSYQQYRDNILGNGNNVIDPDKYKLPKSISSETTFNYDVSDENVIFDEMKNQFQEAYRRLKRTEMLAKTIGYKLKKSDFKTITRSITLEEYTDNDVILLDALDTLFQETFDGEKVRLVGVHLSNLSLKNQDEIPFNLFTYQNF